MSTAQVAGIRALWSVQDACPLDISDIEQIVLDTAATALAEAGRLSRSLSIAHDFLAEAELLNGLNSGQPKFIQRLLRRQGKINRMLCNAVEAVLNSVDESGTTEGRGRYADAHSALNQTRYLNHKARGGWLMRSLRRPQDALNDRMNCSIVYLTDLLMEIKQPEGRLNVHFSELNEVIRWHIKEARHFISRCAWLPHFMRFPFRNQQAINRCHIAAIRLLGDMLMSAD